MDSSGPSSEQTHEVIVSEWWDSDERKKEERKGAHSNTDCRPDFLEQEQTETHIRES